MKPAAAKPLARLLNPSSHIRTKITNLSLDRRRYSTYGYTQAKALVYSSYGAPQDVLSLHKHSISPPHTTQLTLRLLTAPINPADINQIQGVYPSKPPFTSALGTPSPSAVAGNEGCAEVVRAGAGCRTVSAGDWVVMKHTGQGTWRTHMQVDEADVLPIPDKRGLSATQVGTVSVNPCTAYRMLRDFVTLDPARGDWFIQNGANSGVGRAAVQLGRLWGYQSINVVRDRAGVEALKEELRALGATVVVTDKELMAPDFEQRLKDWTDGGREKVRLGLNCVGGQVATVMAKKALAAEGHLVTYGAMSRKPVELPAALLIFRNVVFDGFWVSKWSDANPEDKRRTVEEILQLMREGKFKDVPVQEVPWGWETPKEELIGAVQGALEGFRKGKGIFVFKDT